MRQGKKNQRHFYGWPQGDNAVKVLTQSPTKPATSTRASPAASFSVHRRYRHHRDSQSGPERPESHETAGITQDFGRYGMWPFLCRLRRQYELNRPGTAGTRMEFITMDNTQDTKGMLEMYVTKNHGKIPHELI
jgi:hypothetical protein